CAAFTAVCTFDCAWIESVSAAAADAAATTDAVRRARGWALISTSYDLRGEAVLERELQAVVVDRETVGEILPARPLELAADHHVLDRRAEQVRRRVLADVERIRRLRVAVADVDARVADRGRQLGGPVVIQVRHEPDVPERLAHDRSDRVARIPLDADVDR